ncbi:MULTISPECIES: alpha/beta fold hydrolase [Streptomyces]|uniref:Alpha/beta fold hydrolase n=1 Tax=Streptomyces fimbriatus TaxID=68197 RepID=A0ABW0D645_STRFI
MSSPRTKRRGLLSFAVLLPMAGLIPVGEAWAAEPDGGSPSAPGKPTVVLVHGAWADASGWNEVSGRLQNEGYPVVTTANPLRSLSGDSAYLAARLKAIEGPIVLVGHSYGGSVITNAAVGNPNVKSLVYIAALQPDVGESVLQLATKYPGSRLSDDPDASVPTALNAVPIPGQGDPAKDVELYIKPEKFSEVFLSDRLDSSIAEVLAAAQRSATPAAFGEPSKKPAWKTLPSWALVATEDYTIGTENLRFMAKRAGSHVVEVDAPHAVHLTDPGAVTDLIRRAAQPESGTATPSLAETGSWERTAALGGVSGLAIAGGIAMVALSRRVRPSRR